MESFIPMRLGVLACLGIASVFIIHGAEGAIVVKPRSGVSKFEAPAEDKSVRPETRKPAELAVNVSLPFEKISQLINQFEYRFQGQGTAAAGLINYKGTLTIGKVALASSGQTQFPLRAVAPFKLVATVGGYPLNVNGETTIDFAVDVGSDWCPVLRFGEPSVNFSDKAAALPAKVDKSIPSLSEFVAGTFLSKELKANVTCDIIRKEIAKLWGPVTLPVTFADKKLFIKFDPQSLAVSRFAVDADNISFSLSLGALTAVATKALKPKTAQLPGVKAIAQRSPASTSTEAEATLSLPINLELR